MRWVGQRNREARGQGIMQVRPGNAGACGVIGPGPFQKKLDLTPKVYRDTAHDHFAAPICRRQARRGKGHAHTGEFPERLAHRGTHQQAGFKLSFGVDWQPVGQTTDEQQIVSYLAELAIVEQILGIGETEGVGGDVVKSRIEVQSP